MNKKLSFLITAIVLVLSVAGISMAQMGIGTSNPDPSAALDIVSTDQGVLHPRLTTAQRDAINGPAEGLTIYNTDDDCLQVWNGTEWQCAVGGNSNSSTNIRMSTSGGGIYITDAAPRYQASNSYDQAWIDDDTIVILDNVSSGWGANPPYAAQTKIVSIYNNLTI